MVSLRKTKKRKSIFKKKNLEIFSVVNEKGRTIRKYNFVKEANNNFFIGQIAKYYDVCSFKTGNVLFRVKDTDDFCTIKFLNEEYVIIVLYKKGILVKISDFDINSRDFEVISSISDFDKIKTRMFFKNCEPINENLTVFIDKNNKFLLLNVNTDEIIKIDYIKPNMLIESKLGFFIIRVRSSKNYVDVTYHCKGNFMYFNIIDLNKNKFLFDEFIKGGAKDIKEYDDKLYIITYDALMDGSGRIIFDSDSYLNLYFINDKPFVKTESKYGIGLIKITGEVIFEAKYKEILELPDRFVAKIDITKEYILN